MKSVFYQIAHQRAFINRSIYLSIKVELAFKTSKTKIG